MSIGVEHAAATLARLTGITAPACDGIVIEHGRPDCVIAATIRANPLADTWLLDADVPGTCVLAWSGNLGDAPFDTHMVSPFEREPMTWLAPGRAALARFCDELAPQLDRTDRRLCFEPHSRHVLNDVPSCLAFLNEHVNAPFDIALAPGSMLEPSMMPDVHDHLTRMFEALGHRCALVVLRDAVVVTESATDGGDADGWMQPTPLGRGCLPRAHVRSLLKQHVPHGTPIVISGVAIAEQLAWLEPSRA